MFKLWAKTIRHGKLLSDLVIENDQEGLSRTQKIFAALETACGSFDLSVPIWLDSNISEFKGTSRTRFTQDNFFDAIAIDFLEISVIEED